MQNPSEKSKGKQDESANGTEDSPMMAIEYLRARLLAERSVSKAAKERADELANRVSGLEEQLKIVTFQRKRAEKATLDVLSYLASHGVSDISEVYESESDQEESLYESNEVKCDTSKEEGNFGSSEKGNDKESLGSDHDSTPSSSRSLSWKGHMETTEHLEKKSFGSSFNKRNSLPLVCYSPRHRSGRSCRQIKRRELRSAVEGARQGSATTDSHDNNTVNSLDNIGDCLNRGNEDLESSHGERVQRKFQKNEGSLSSLAHEQKHDASRSHTHECGMERALADQAQLIGCYEVQEKAQRDWEEKYGENNTSTPDSCEPSNRSDVTEERYDSKTAVPHRTEIAAGHGCDQRAGVESHLQGKEPSITDVESFKFTSHADAGCSQNHNVNEMKASKASVSVSTCSVVNNMPTNNHGASPSLLSVSQNTRNSQRPTDPTTSSYVDGIFCVQPENLNRHCALVPQEEPLRLGAVLGALQEAKSLIKQQMNSFPETSGSVGNEIETPASASRDGDQFKVPLRCPGLFRVPTDLQSQPSQSRLLGSQFALELINSYSGTPASQGGQYTCISRPMEPRYGLPNANPFFSGRMIGTEPGSSHGQSRYDFHFNNGQSMYKSNFSSYLSVPNFSPQVSSNQISYSSLQSEAGVPSSGIPLYYGQDGRSNMYR